MATDRMAIMLKILQSLNESVVPTAQALEIDASLFNEILEAMQDRGLIKGVTIKYGGQRDKPLLVWADGAKITVPGIEYLDARK